MAACSSRAIAPALAILALVASNAGAARAAEQTVHESFAAAADVGIRLTNVSGRIQIRPWDANTVDVVAVKHGRDAAKLAEITIDIAHDGNRTRSVNIRTRYPEGGDSQDLDTVDYTLNVPRRAHLQIANVSGDITADGFAGDVTASNVTGAISTEDTDGSVKLRTVSGAISASLTRMNGSRFASLRTVNGPIKLAVPRNSGATVRVRSLAGHFQSDFPVGVHSELVGTRVDDRIGDGSGEIDMESVAGSLTLDASR